MPLWAVENDIDTHVDGHLIPNNPKTVFINFKPVIRVRDPAWPDDGRSGEHSNPWTLTGSPDVFAYNTKAHRERDYRICGAQTIVRGHDSVFVNS